MTRSSSVVGTGSPGVNSVAQNSSAGTRSAGAPGAGGSKVRRTTSGSMITLQLTVPSSVSGVPGHGGCPALMLAGSMVPFPIWCREKMSVR
jgi:hypothetical protein